MLEDSHAGQDGKGIWLWTLASGLMLFLMELVLFAALVPSDWAREVGERERASLIETVGPETANAILERAAGWYAALFVQTGLEPGSYRLLLPDARTGGAGLDKLADSPFWSWLDGRLSAVWQSLAQACRRLAALLSWWPLLAVLGVAAWGDGWLRRRIRQHAFAYASPLAHRLSLRAILWLTIAALLALVAPIPLPALAIPAFGAAVVALLALALANAQKRL